MFNVVAKRNEIYIAVTEMKSDAETKVGGGVECHLTEKRP